MVRILAVREAKEAKNLREASYNARVSDTVLSERLEEVSLVSAEGVSREVIAKKYIQEVNKEVSRFYKVYSAY